MRFLIFFNLIAIIVIGAALARMYQGTPLPWQLTYASRSAAPANTPISEEQASSAANPGPVVPEENPKRAGKEQPDQTAANAGKTLRFLTEGNYPPFSDRSVDGQLVGYDVDTAKAICQHLSRPCEVVARSWSDLLPALRDDQGDAVVASMLIGSPAIDKQPGIAFSKPYYMTPGHFAARRDSTSLSALAGRTIAVQSGSTHEAYLKARFPDAKRLAVKTLAEGEKALADHRADLVFADRNALLIWLKDKKEGACCHLVGGDYNDPKYFGTGAGLVVRADDKALLAQIDQALSEMARDGTETKIAKPYFGQSIR